MLWTQGGSDISEGTTKLDYYNRLNQLISDYNTDLTTITKQHHSLMWIGSQESVKPNLDQDGIAQAQYDVMLNNPSFTLANPVYILKFEFDNAHYKPESDRIQGAYYGIFAHRWLTGATKPYPLYPFSFTITGNSIAIKFHVPVLPLKIDTTIITAETNYGFRVVNNVGTDITITSITITSDDTVTIVCSASPVGGRVLYARPKTDTWINFGTYQMLGGRGNLRDSQGDKVKRYGYDMHNFCLAFNISI